MAMKEEETQALKLTCLQAAATLMAGLGAGSYVPQTVAPDWLELAKALFIEVTGDPWP